MLAEGANSSYCWALEFTSFVIERDKRAAAVSNFGSPQTSISVLIKSKAWWTLVSISMTILTVPEDSTILRVCVCSI